MVKIPPTDPSMRALLGAPTDPNAQLQDGPIAPTAGPVAAPVAPVASAPPSPTVTPNYHPAAPSHPAPVAPAHPPATAPATGDPAQPWTESPVTPDPAMTPQSWSSNDPDPTAAPPAQTPAQAAQAAKDAAFARQKEAIGQTMRASLTALRENLAGRGALGGGPESGGMASLLGEGQGALSDVVSNQAAFDVAGHNATANRNYAGDIQKRGQDMGMTASMLSLLGSQAY